MTYRTLSILSNEYFSAYNKKQKLTLSKHFAKLKSKTLSNDYFFRSNILSSVFSSMIEGVSMDINSFLRIREEGLPKNKDYNQVSDLILAYEFAQKNKLSIPRILKAHALATQTIFNSDKNFCGVFRKRKVFVRNYFETIYTAAEPEIVEGEMKKLLTDISILLKKELSYAEVFYFASLIHLRVAQIHPFADGNGRTARLMEKWFIAEKLGSAAWGIPSELLYFERRKSYYERINLGKNYHELNYDLCLPFLLMLPMAMKVKVE